jgi:Fe-S-cluster containining protein
MTAAVPEALQSAFERERQEARRTRTSDAADVRTETVRMYGRLAALQDDVAARAGVAFACKAGCSYCCHLRVEIRPHDAFVLAQHIDRHFSAAQRSRLLARIDANLARIAPMSAEQHVRAGIGCALLEDGRCSAYEARPATCRKYHSVSVQTCRAAFDDTSAPLTGDIENDDVRLAGNAVALGFAQGLDDAGYDSALYELHHALSKALTDPRTERRYRRGKRAFV